MRRTSFRHVLTGVIFGSAISDTDKLKVKEWIGKGPSRPRCYRARLNQTEFALDIEPEPEVELPKAGQEKTPRVRDAEGKWNAKFHGRSGAAALVLLELDDVRRFPNGE